MLAILKNKKKSGAKAQEEFPKKEFRRARTKVLKNKRIFERRKARQEEKKRARADDKRLRELEEENLLKKKKGTCYCPRETIKEKRRRKSFKKRIRKGMS